MISKYVIGYQYTHDRDKAQTWQQQKNLVNHALPLYYYVFVCNNVRV